MADGTDTSPAPRRFGLGRKWVALALLVAVIGLPINHLFGYGMLAVAAVIIFYGEVTAQLRPWLLAALIALVASIGQYLLNPPRIDEGHNIFLTENTDSNPLLTGLPPDVYRLMAEEFVKLYPPERRCDPKNPGCTHYLPPERTYGFAADGIYDRPEFSRKVDGINFGDPVWLRLGVTNEMRYNWTGPGIEITRGKRDGRFWAGLHRWQLTMPFFVMYRFPAAYAGSDLCWKGDVLWEERNQQFVRLSNPVWACRTLEPSYIGKRIYGVAIKPGSLAMALDPPVTVHLRQALATALAVFAVVSILGLLARWTRRQVALPFVLIGLALTVIAVNDASVIGGLRPLDGGDDGLFYESVGRQIAQYILAGDFARALEGGEKVFFYGGPGLRYLRAFERFLFGDSNLGYLALLLILPLIVFALYRRLLPVRWALALVFIFIAVPVGAVFGTSYFLYAKWVARGFADPAACIFAFAGVLYLIGLRAQGPGNGFAAACGSAALLALAVFVRPNIAPFVGVMLGGAGLAALYRHEWTRLAGLCIGFTPILLMPLHNWYFGGELVLFSSNSTHPLLLTMPPSAYLSALSELVRLDLAGDNLGGLVRQMTGWLSGPAETRLMIPLHAVAVAIVVRVALIRCLDGWVRLLAAATLTQHATAFFYIATPRYHFLAWFFTGILVAIWLRAEGLELARQYWPTWWERARRNPFNRFIELTLRRVEVLSGLSRFPMRSGAGPART